MSVVIVRNKGLLVPQEYLEQVLELNTASFGVAFVKDKKILVNKIPAGLTFEEFDAVQKKFIDYEMIAHFGDVTSQHEDDLQPYSLLRDGKDDDLLVGILDGDFSNCHVADGTHVDTFYAVNNHVIPLASQMCRLAKEDLGMIVEELKGTTMKKALLQAAGDDGTMTFLARNNVIWTFSNNKDASQFPWGWVSDTLGYKEQPTQAPAPTPKPKSRLAALLGEDAPEPAPIKEEPVTPAPQSLPDGVHVVPGKTDTAAPSELNLPYPYSFKGGKILFACPATVKTKNLIKNEYYAKAGFCPENWHKRPEVIVSSKIEKELLGTWKPGTVPTVIKDVKDLGAAMKNVGSYPEKEDHAEQPTVVVPPKAHDVPFLPKPLMDKIEKYLIDKCLDKNGQVIIDPNQIQNMEYKMPTFFELFGLKKEDVVGIPFSGLLDLGNISIKALALYALNFRTLYAKEIATQEAQGVLDNKTPPKQTSNPLQLPAKKDRKYAM